MWFRFLTFPLALIGGLIAAAFCLVGLVVALAYPNLPSLDALTDYQPKVPLRVYTVEGVLIGEFGEERRVLVDFQNVPPAVVNAIIAAEDERYLPARWHRLCGRCARRLRQPADGRAPAGGEHHHHAGGAQLLPVLGKDAHAQALRGAARAQDRAQPQQGPDPRLYINQIYLGQRAYGFAAASQIYFGKSLDELSIGEAAMLAALPKAPSSYNPIANPQRAKQRQQYVLRRMKDLGYITDADYEAALKAPIVVARKVADSFAVQADHVAEMVRQAVYEQYPEDAYSRGFRVYTTIRQADQQAAYEALRAGLLEYDRRQGYRGPEGFVDLPPDADEDDFEEALAERAEDEQLRLALVLSVTPKEVEGGSARWRARDGQRARACDSPRPRCSAPRRSAVSAEAR